MNDVRERTLRERTLKKWGDNSWAVALLFTEHPDMGIPLHDIYKVVRSIYLNMESKSDEDFTEKAVRAVLWRFAKDGYLRKRKPGGRRTNPVYYITDLGLVVFRDALEKRAKWADEGSHSEFELVRLPSSMSSRQVDIGLRPWREIVGIDSGWQENTRITKVWLDPFIIQNLRRAISDQPNEDDPAEWISVQNEHFTLKVSKVRSVQLWVKSERWRDELQKWLETVPNLKNHHLDAFWNKVEDRAGNIVTTREFHVTDPRLSESRVHLFRGSRPRRWQPKDDNEVCQISRGIGGGILGASEGCGQRLHESCRAICSSSNLPAHLRTRIIQGHRAHEARVRPARKGTARRIREEAEEIGALSGGI